MQFKPSLELYPYVSIVKKTEARRRKNAKYEKSFYAEFLAKLRRGE